MPAGRPQQTEVAPPAPPARLPTAADAVVPAAEAAGVAARLQAAGSPASPELQAALFAQDVQTTAAQVLFAGSGAVVYDGAGSPAGQPAAADTAAERAEAAEAAADAMIAGGVMDGMMMPNTSGWGSSYSAAQYFGIGLAVMACVALVGGERAPGGALRGQGCRRQRCSLEGWLRAACALARLLAAGAWREQSPGLPAPALLPAVVAPLRASHLVHPPCAALCCRGCHVLQPSASAGAVSGL